MADLKGSKTYRRRLRNAASAIYDLLRLDPVILSLSGKPAEYKGKERAIFPSFDPRGRTQTLAALEAVLHSCALMASYPAVPSGSGTPKRNEYVAVPLNGNDTVEGKPYGRLSHVGLVRAVLALAHYIPHGSTVPWLKLFYGFYDSETKRGISSRIQPSSDFLNWMMGRGLIFVGHPYGTDPKPASTDWPLLWVSQKYDGKRFRWPLTRPLAGDEAVLSSANERLAKLRVDFVFPSYSEYVGNGNFHTGKAKAIPSGRTQLYRQLDTSGNLARNGGS